MTSEQARGREARAVAHLLESPRGILGAPGLGPRCQQPHLRLPDGSRPRHPRSSGTDTGEPQSQLRPGTGQPQRPMGARGGAGLGRGGKPWTQRRPGGGGEPEVVRTRSRANLEAPVLGALRGVGESVQSVATEES